MLDVPIRADLQSNDMDNFPRIATICLYWCLGAIFFAAGALSPLNGSFAEEAAPGATNPAKLDPAKIDELIAQLGSDEFTIREKAADQLTRLGLPAFEALERAARHPDREVRYRSQRILGLVRQIDLERRLEAFVNGESEAEDYPLPGWSRFKKAHGDESPARKLFVEMQRADADLLQSIEEGPQSAARLLSQRASQQQQALRLGAQQASFGQIVATLFVASQEDVSLPAQTLSIIFSHCYQPAFRDILTNSSQREIPRQMLGSIIRRSEDLSAYQAMTIAYQFNMTEGVVPATKILDNLGQGPPHMAQFALMTLARVGDASHLPIVERMLDNKSPLTRLEEKPQGEEKVVYEVQVRDAALAAAVMLSGQKIPVYFDVPQDQQSTDPQQIMSNARLIGFTSDEARARTFEKWAKYKAAQAKSANTAKPQP